MSSAAGAPTQEALEVAFVFGAGGSIDKVPAQSTLLERFLDATAEGAPPVDGVPSHVPALLQAARLYLERTFPGPRRERVPYENVVGPLEISEAEEYWFHYAGPSRALSKSDKPHLVTNRKVLDGLDAWLVRALDPPGFPKRPFEADYGRFYGGENAQVLSRL